MNRYKLCYNKTTGALDQVLEVLNASGVVRGAPVVHVPTDANWGTFVSGINCTETTPDTITKTLCMVDQVPAPSGTTLISFTREVCIDKENGAVSIVGDFTEDYSANYTVAGTAVLAASVGNAVTGIKAFRVKLEDDGQWSKPNTLVQSIGIKVPQVGNAGNPPTITIDGDTTTLALGDVETWSIVTDIGAEILTSDFTVDTNNGDIVVINYTQIDS